MKIEKILVTEENIDELRDNIPVLDQAAEIEIGHTISSWPIYYQPGNQRGQITVWHDTDRAAVCFGADSLWGDWNEQDETIDLDEPLELIFDGITVYRVSKDGEYLTVDGEVIE